MAFELNLSRVAQRLDSDGGDVWAVSDRAAEMEKEGIDVIRLCVGDPDFDTPTPIHAAVGQSLRQGRTHYSASQGEPELRAAIAALETKTSPHPCSADEIVVFPGATNALYSVLSCLLNNEDELLVPDPMYVGYCGFLAAIGCQVTQVPLNVARNFALDIEAIKAAVTVKTRVVLINTPGNPAGNMITPEEMAELAEFCRDKGLWLVCDEVYSMITFARRHTSLRAAAKHLDNVIMVDGLSKSHAMSGWRVGWAVAPKALIPHLSHFAGATVFGCPQFIQDAAAFALRHDEYYVAKMREEYRTRRDYVVERINAIDGLNCQAPDAGMFVMADVSALGLDGRQFAEALLEEQQVCTVPGEGFGESTRNYVRITLAQSVEVLRKAFDRIEAFVNHQHRQAQQIMQ